MCEVSGVSTFRSTQAIGIAILISKDLIMPAGNH